MTMVRIWSAQAAHLAWEQTSPASRPEQAVPAWDQPQRLPARGERPTSHVHQILGPRPAGSRTPLGGTPTATWTMTSATSATAPAGPAMAAPSQPARAASTPRPSRRRRSTTSLGRWSPGPSRPAPPTPVHAGRHRARCPPPGPRHDRQHHTLADARVAFGGRQLPDGGAECPRVRRVDGWGVGDVEHGIATHQRDYQSPSPLARSTRPRGRAQPHRVLLERRDGLATSQSRCTGQRHPHDRTSCSLPANEGSVMLGACWHRRDQTIGRCRRLPGGLVPVAILPAFVAAHGRAGLAG
jgi:hypothetical protein